MKKLKSPEEIKEQMKEHEMTVAHYNNILNMEGFLTESEKDHKKATEHFIIALNWVLGADDNKGGNEG